MPANALLISGDPQAREGLIGLVQAFDVDVLARQSYALLPVSAGDVKDFASALQDAFRGQNGGALAGLVRVIPLSRINAVLVVSAQPQYIDQARRVYALIDRPFILDLIPGNSFVEYLVQQGFGTWAEVCSFSDDERIELYLASRQAEGWTIDWSTGEATPPPKE